MATKYKVVLEIWGLLAPYLAELLDELVRGYLEKKGGKA